MRKTIRKKMLLLPIILLLTISAINVSIPSVSAVDSPYIAVLPTRIEDDTLTQGNTFTVSINTNYDGSDVWAYQFSLSYDPSVIQGVSVTNGDLITGFYAQFIPGTFDNTAGTLSLTTAFDIYLYTTSGPGTLANVTFTVMGTGTSDITIGTETQLKAPGYNIIDALFNPNQIGHGYFDNTGGVTDPESPMASFTWSPVTPYPEEDVDFDASGSSDPDGVIVSYEWDFGDGSNTTTGLEVIHVYSTAGTYVATLTVTDDAALTDTATATIEVFPPLQMDLKKWKAKPEHKHFDISKDEDSYCDLTALVRNDYNVDKLVTVDFVIINKETNEIEIVDVTDTVYKGTTKSLTCSKWIPSPGTYSISVTGTFDLGTTTTKITRVGVVP